MYDEFNADAKPPSNAVAIDLNPDKTHSRRFMAKILGRSKVLAYDEVETRRNTIGGASRKLITTPTIEASVRPYTKILGDLEDNVGDGRYDDLVDFICAAFDEWSNHYPAYKPKATRDQRWGLREESFALSNIMMFPIMRMLIELWRDYDDRKIDWRKNTGWQKALAHTSPRRPPEYRLGARSVQRRASPDRWGRSG